jgi:hypothetical protein
MALFVVAILGTSGDHSWRGVGVALGFAVALVVSIGLHHVAHAFAAYAFHQRVSEIDLTVVGNHMRFESARISPGVSMVVALAGPAMNGVVAWWAVVARELSSSPSSHATLTWLIHMNVVLAVINGLPGLPLDGGAVLEAMVWRITGKKRMGRVVGEWASRIVAGELPLWESGFASALIPRKLARQPWSGEPSSSSG